MTTALFKIRKKYGYLQKDVASVIGVTPKTLCLLEQGKTVPTLATAKKLARFYECQIEDLFEVTE